ncbi:MAG: hypothetical protein ACLUI0_12675 [Blautia massiliensis (ex Durand et al. 2017)]
MADQNITALPVAASPASSDQLLLVGATEEKLIDYDKLADAILTKLTSKQYTLDQGTKTLPAALNELNSNRVAVYIGKITTSKTGEIATNNFINGSSIKNIIAVKIFDSAGSRNVHTELYSYKTYAFVVAKNDVGDRLVNTELDIVAFYIK